MGLKGVCDTFLSPLRWSAERRTTTPVPSSEEGDYGAGKRILSDLQAMVFTSRWFMVMVSGASGLQEKGGRSPPPKRGRLGGGRCAAAPYKHRLAHDPGGRRPSGRAFRCVGFLGRSPKPFLHPFVGTKGCPRRVGVQIRTFYKSCVAVRREETVMKPASRWLGCGTDIFRGSIPAEGGNGEKPRRLAISPNHSWGRW